jgi:XTP/dITP diphosphohydrolase
MTTIVLASSNQKKLQELQAMLAGKAVTFVPQTNFNIIDAVEDGQSFVANALIKAKHASRLTGLPALADDSGLEVDSLGGAPGIYSARFANIHGTGNSSDADNNALLLARLAGVPEAQRCARFRCAIVLVRTADDPLPVICEGTWEGNILATEAGSNGFGYDPLFYVPTHGCASAQLSAAVKNSISHRAQALLLLLQRWPF